MLRSYDLSEKYCGEGITVYHHDKDENDRLANSTDMERKEAVFIYDMDFSLIEEY